MKKAAFLIAFLIGVFSFGFSFAKSYPEVPIFGTMTGTTTFHYLSPATTTNSFGCTADAYPATTSWFTSGCDHVAGGETQGLNFENCVYAANLDLWCWVPDKPIADIDEADYYAAFHRTSTSSAWQPIFNLTQTPLVLPTSYGDTDFSPIYPVDGQFNLVSSSGSSTTIFFTGTFYAADCSTYNKVYAYLYDASNPQNYTTTSLGTLEPVANCSPTQYGSILSYSTSVSMPNGTYFVSYKAEGYDQQYLYTSFTHWVPGTSVGNNAPTTAFDPNNIGSYLSCLNAYNDCINNATGSIAEQWIGKAGCAVSGAFWSLFCPNPEALTKAKGILNDAKNRFPLTLAYAIKTDLTSLSSSSSLATSTATTSIMQYDFSWVSKFGEMTAFETIRNILVLISWLGIGIAALIYTQKHLFSK